MRTISKSMLIALLTLALIWACSQEAKDVSPSPEITLSKNVAASAIMSAPQSDAGIYPYLIVGQQTDGNRSCDEAATAFEIEGLFQFSSGPNTYNPADGTFDGPWVPDLFVTVTEDRYVEWSGTPTQGYCVVNIAVIVKGVDGEANVYFYPDGSLLSDKGLAPPEVDGEPLILDNLTICWNVEPCEEEKCYGGSETAFGGNNEGDGKAWWFYYDVATGGEQKIWAGQHMEAGTVKYDGDKIIINLEGWALQDTPEAVKIQGYNTLPEKRQPAGKFTTYKGMSLEPEVDDFDYYVIHLDVIQEIECEEE